MLNGAQVKLVSQGQADIVASSAIFSGSTLTAAFNLTGAPAGPRDVVVIAPSGAVNAIPNGFVVAQNASCTYTVLPQSTLYYSQGGPGSLAVSALPLDVHGPPAPPTHGSHSLPSRDRSNLTRSQRTRTPTREPAQSPSQAKRSL